MKKSLLKHAYIVFSLPFLFSLATPSLQAETPDEAPFLLNDNARLSEQPQSKRYHGKRHKNQKGAQYFGTKNKRNIVVVNKNKNKVVVNTSGGGVGPIGPVGPTGPTGAQGLQGPIGPSGISGAGSVSGFLTILFTPHNATGEGITGSWHLAVVAPDTTKYVYPVTLDLNTGPFSEQAFEVPPPHVLPIGTYDICLVSNGITGPTNFSSTFLESFTDIKIENSITSDVVHLHGGKSFFSGFEIGPTGGVATDNFPPGYEVRCQYTTPFSAQ